MKPDRAIAYRKQIAALIQAVLDDEISPQTALNCWSPLANEDPSIHCAYTMVWYYEADDERHFQEVYYSDLQVQLLQEVCTLLKAGQALPEQMIKQYSAIKAPYEYSGSWMWRSPWWRLKQLVNELYSICQTHPWVGKGAHKPKGP